MRAETVARVENSEEIPSNRERQASVPRSQRSHLPVGSGKLHVAKVKASTQPSSQIRHF